MRFLSVCSGIDVASLAWGPLGWSPVLLSEIEPFPREVLRLRYGAEDARRTRAGTGPVLWGDFASLRMRHLRRLGINPAAIDVLVGGTPCQAFSIAGLRRSLDDPRGNLALAFLRLAHAINAVRLRAGRPGLIVVWENVPGVFSAPGNAFGHFLAGLVGADAPLCSPLERGRWPRVGLVAGPRARAAWRVLDAQHFRLAQRRERVFLVGDLGGGVDPAAVLLEPKGLRGDPAPGREAPEDLAASLTASAGGVSGKDGVAGRVVVGTLTGGAWKAGGYSTDDIPLVSACLNGLNSYDADKPTLRATGGDAGGGSEALLAFGGNRQSGPIQVATALNAHGGPHGRLDFEAETFVVTPFDTTQITSATNRSNPKAGAPCRPLSASAHPPAIAFNARQDPDVSGPVSGPLDTDGGTHAVLTSGVRRLMPVECERLQGVPDDFTRIPWRGRPAEECPTGPATSSSATPTRGPSWPGSAGGSPRLSPPRSSHATRRVPRRPGASLPGRLP